MKQALVALTWLLLLACERAAPGDVADAAVADTTIDAAPPSPPPDLVRWLVGSPSDAVVESTRGLILMGGGPDVNAAFAWQRDRMSGGDVVVLRASGGDGYNEYLFDDIGGVDSVETLIVPTRELAAEPYVIWALDHAEAIFIAGGDQSVYVAAWKDGPVEDALNRAWQRGAVVGGTSAGAAILGSAVYSAAQGTVYSDEALEDPYNPYMTFEHAFLSFPPLAGVVTDTHFAARDRMGRLIAFAARELTDGWAPYPIGLGIDEGTALVIDETSRATVVGSGAVYVVRPRTEPAACAAGVPLAWTDVPVFKLKAGDAVVLPDSAPAGEPLLVSASDGSLVPSNPY